MGVKTTVGVVKRRFEVKENKVLGILNYGKDNIYPQRILLTTSASGTASSCIKLYAKYIRGRGFSDSEFYKLKINRWGVTLDKVLRSVSFDLSRNQGFALHITYNGLLKISEVNFIPFENCRLTIPDDTEYVAKVAVHYDWAGWYCRFNQKDIKKYHIFNPDPEIVMAQIQAAGGIEKYTGQVLYFSMGGNFPAPEYPLASCDPVYEDVESDANLKGFRWKSIGTGFMSRTMLVHKGKFENEEERKSFKENVQTFQGPDANQVLVVEAETEEEVPELVDFKGLEDARLLPVAESSLKNSIIQNYGQPLVLLSIKTPGQLGNSQEFIEAQKFYDDYTVDERMIIEETFKMIFVNWKKPVNSANDYRVIPISGIVDTNDKKPLVAILGVGGLQSLTTVLESTTLEDQQKINILVTVFGMSIEDSTAVVEGTELEIKK